jgi:phage portal protein BeeE
MAAVATITATESNLALVIVLNVAAGVIMSSVIFMAVSLVAHRVADDRLLLARATQEGQWRARAHLLAICNEENGLYTDWYFRLRMQEEVERSTRYGLHFAVLLVTPLGVHQSAEVEQASVAFGKDSHKHLRRSDVPALLRDGKLAVLLPHTSRQSAMHRRLIKKLAPTGAQVGLACFPEDGKDALALLNAAAAATVSEPQDAVAAASTRLSLPA